MIIKLQIIDLLKRNKQTVALLALYYLSLINYSL